MASVTFESVRKTYDGGVAAVKGVSLEVRDGEFLVLVGPSGCGKTTLLRMVAGLEEITEGTIRIGERAVNDVAPKDRDVAMVFQNYALYPHMTVRENMAFGLRMRKAPQAEVERRVGDAARILGLAELLDRKPKALSGGQRQRVALGRAIVRDPKVFLLDEPLSNLDAKLRVDMRAELKRLHRRLGTTILYVTHDQVEAMTLGDRIVVMDGGKVQQAGTPLALYDRPANRFVAGFLGNPAMNFLDGVLEADGRGFAFRAGAARVALPAAWTERLRARGGGPVVLGVRPEGLCEKGRAAGGADGRVLPALVDVVEPLGDENLVYLLFEGRTMISRMDAHVRMQPGERVEMALEDRSMHLFDPIAGESLTA